MKYLLSNKNIVVSLIVIAALIAGYFLLLRPKTGLSKENVSKSVDQSIAVLPFVNMSNDTLSNILVMG